MADDLIITLDGGDWLAVVLATVAAFMVGFVWFTFLFGKQWAKEMGMEMDPENAPGFKEMAPSMAKDLIGHFLMAYVLFHSIVVWLPSLWAENLNSVGEDAARWTYGVYGAFFVWLGFFLPGALSRTGWEGRSWKWFGIDVGYSLVKLLIMGQILVAF